MKRTILALTLLLAGISGSKAEWGNVNGQPVWFGSSGHWAVQYPDEGGEVPDIIWRESGESWDFQSQDEDSGDGE